MNSVKKNRIVVVALVLMIVAAGYLNHQSQQKMNAVNGTAVETEETAEVLQPEDVTLESAEELDETSAMSMEQEVAAEDTTEETALVEDTAVETAEGTPGEAVFVESDAIVPEYFAEAKVERENARAKSQDILYDLMANADTPEAKKTEAADEIIKLQKRIENEAAAEAMIKAKGFDNAFVRIYDGSVDVIVDREELTQQEAAQIQDIVTRVTGVKASDIRISLLKIGAGTADTE